MDIFPLRSPATTDLFDHDMLLHSFLLQLLDLLSMPQGPVSQQGWGVVAALAAPTACCDAGTTYVVGWVGVLYYVFPVINKLCLV